MQHLITWNWSPVLVIRLKCIVNKTVDHISFDDGTLIKLIFFIWSASLTTHINKKITQKFFFQAHEAWILKNLKLEIKSVPDLYTHILMNAKCCWEKFKIDYFICGSPDAKSMLLNFIKKVQRTPSLFSLIMSLHDRCEGFNIFETRNSKDSSLLLELYAMPGTKSLDGGRW